jgi:hypothetical protein
MMTVLLCLLSDQHVPNLLSVHHYQPEQLVLVESPQMQKRGASKHFLEALSRGSLDYGSRCHVQQVPAEDNLGRISAGLQEAYGRYSSASWVANVTGGTKPMSIATYDFFKAVGGKVVYTNLAQPERIVDLDKGTAETFTHRPSVDEFVTGYGFRLVKPAKDLDEAKERAGQDLWRKTANLLSGEEAGYDGPALDDSQRERARKRGLELKADQFAFPCEELRQMWLEGKASRTLTKYEGEFLTGGWLEVFFYNLLSRHADQLGIWDVALGQSLGTENTQTSAPNDIDVCFMHNHGLAMVECKSGSQEHDDSRGMDTLYKTEAVARQQGALRVRSFFATTAANVLDKSGSVRDGLKKRADMYKCTILTREQIRELAELESAGSDQTAARVMELFRL